MLCHFPDVNLDIATLANIGIALLGALVAYRFALAAYFRQKEFENVRARYLDQGVELACSQVDYALGVFRHNWMLMLRAMKQYREAEQLVPFDDLLNQLREVDQSRFQLTPVYKIQTLVGNGIFWIAYQKVFAFVGTANETIKADFALALRGMLQQPNHPRKAEFLRTAEDTAARLNRDAQRFYSVVGELQNLAEILERDNLSRKSIKEFGARSDVRDLVARVSGLFPEEQN
jgi:hypothetical protein